MFESSLKYITRKDESGNFLPIENRRKVFISYRKKDNLNSIRDRIAECILLSLDCAVWYDTALTPGVDYDIEISNAIRDTDVVILLLTPTILESKYVWDIEVEQAIKQKKGIIPITLGISDKHRAVAEEKLGHIQMLSGNCLCGSCSVEEKNVFIDDLSRALNQFIVSHDIAMSVTRFFAAKKDLLPTRVLSFEQMYLMAYGLLKGIGTESSIEEAILILSSLLNVYAKDEDTIQLKGEIAYLLLIYYTNTANYEMALKYAEKGECYSNLQSLFHIGQMYYSGNLFEKDREKALEYFEKGAKGGHLDSIRSAAKIHASLLSEEIAIQYFKQAAEHGCFSDMLNLVIYSRNTAKTEEGKKNACELLKSEIGMKYKESREIYDVLSGFSSNTGYLSSYKARQYRDVDKEERLGEITYRQTKFFLCREVIDEIHTDMVLVRENKKIYEFGCYARGFGDIDSFDLQINEDGLLVVKSADFDHYGPETTFCDNIIINPLSDDILVLAVRDEEYYRGRRLLRYTSY